MSLHAIFFLFIGALLGLWLRLYLSFGTELAFPYVNVLHAHSHVLFFGWITITIGLCLLRDDAFFQRFFVPLCSIGTAVTLVTFLKWGYAAPSIAASGLFFLPWGYIIFKTYRSRLVLESTGAAALALSIVSTLALPLSVALGISQEKRNILVQLFLHLFIDGWIILSLLAIVTKLAVSRLSAAVYLAGLIAASLAPVKPEYAHIGGYANAVSAGVLLYWIWKAKRSFFNPLLKIAFWVTVIRCLCDIGWPLGFFEITREFIIAHIHARTLGFATCTAVALLTFNEPKSLRSIIYLCFGGGSVSMLLGLMLQGMPAVSNDMQTQLEFARSGMVFGSVLLVIGAGVLLVRGALTAQRATDDIRYNL